LTEPNLVARCVPRAVAVTPLSCLDGGSCACVADEL
jgi:hypothetical protein